MFCKLPRMPGFGSITRTDKLLFSCIGFHSRIPVQPVHELRPFLMPEAQRIQHAIEVPGEANPLTEHTLLNVLRSAASSDPQQIQSGAKQLERWEKDAGFYKHLQSVFIDKSQPFEVRYLAIIQLKNGIEKYWRKTAAK